MLRHSTIILVHDNYCVYLSQKHETIGELLCMDQDMSGFKGTLPDYQNRVQLSAPHRELVKQGPLVKYSRKTTCQRFFFLVSESLGSYKARIVYLGSLTSLISFLMF